jgi:Rps23 Pro-64 3,4-dihydroxylase Tpa1-like proline 4-hydroxylase
MIDLSLSTKLQTQYRTAYPIPYVVIDNFLPEFALNSCREEILKHDIWHCDTVDWTKEFQQNKFYYPNENTDISEIQQKLPVTTLIMNYLNSPEFITYLENLTGFKKLYRDPKLLGGGIHRIKRGGKLAIHKDYNQHPETKKQRRLNLLIYLNKNWNAEWGGNLELWSHETWKKVIEIEPIFNRAVIFDIDKSPHGHPHPLNTPEEIDRYSLALYYFTDTEVKENNKRTVVFYRDEEVGISNKTTDKEIEDLFK